MAPEATPDAEPHQGSETEDLGTGLYFFPPGTAPEVQRRRWIFVALGTVAALMVIWPVYPFFARPKPLILGLPFSLAWVLAALTLVFVALLWLFRGEPDDPADAGDGV